MEDDKIEDSLKNFTSALFKQKIIVIFKQRNNLLDTC